MGQLVNLNIIPKGIPDVVNASQYDVGRVIQFALYDGATPYSIPLTATVQIAGKKGDNTIFCYDETDNVVSWTGNTVTITSTQQMTAFAGEVLAQLRVINSGVTIATVNFKMLIQVRPDAEGDISETEIPAIIALAEEQELDAEAWAKGTKNGIPVGSGDIQYNDHAKYWAEQAEAAAQSFADGIRYKGAITFATIPTSGMENGWEYNVTDAFTTDSRFSEGSGIYCEAGTNIIWSEDAGKWDIAGGLGGVQSFNGRHGNITPAANDYSYSQISDTPTIPTAYTSAPEMDGTASAGSSTAWAKGDHIHPSDTSKADVSIIAEEFDATAIYAVDDYVMYNGGFYKCTTAHTGEWDANDFTQTLVSDEFGSGGGGGSTAEYSYNIVTKSTGNYDASITVKKYIDGVLDTSTDYLYSDLTPPVTFDGLFTIGYGNTRYTLTLIENSTTHTSGYTENWLYNASVDFTETFIVEAVDLSYIAPAFSSSVAYAVGDLVTHEAKLYKCTTAHAAGSWNPQDFTQTTVEDELATKANSSSLGTAAAKNVPASGNASTTEVVMGDDTRLTDARTPTAHTHNYAGSASAGGPANSVAASLNLVDSNRTLGFNGDTTRTLAFRNIEVSVYENSWSATPNADGYYTQTKNILYISPLSFKPIIAIKDNATAAQMAAYSLCDKFVFDDSNAVSTVTVYAKTKPTADFHVTISGVYFA